VHLTVCTKGIFWVRRWNMNFKTRQVIFVPEIKSSNPQEYFILGSVEVDIKYLGENFMKLTHRSCVNKGSEYYVGLTLALPATCNDFISAFKQRCFVSLSLIWYLLCQQPHGETGFLFIDGRANVFVVSVDDSIFSIGASWSQGMPGCKSGWSIGAHPFISLRPRTREWFSGSQIIVHVI